MDSFTKPEVTDDQLEKIARRHLGGKPASTRELKDGWFNAAFAITVADAHFVLKIAPADAVRVLRYEHNLMAAEVGAMREIAAKTTLPIPKIVAFDQTRSDVGSDYFIAECVPGRPLDGRRETFTPEILSDIDRQIGALLRELHTIKGKAFGTYNKPIYCSWTDAFVGLLEDLKKDQQDAHIELPKDSFEAAVPHLGALAEVDSPALVHWDLWDPNIFVDPEGGQITGLIDFERAMWADPLIEGNFQRPSAALLEGYGHPITQPAGASARRRLYDLYLSLIMVIESTYRKFTPEHEKSSREFLERSIAALNALP